MEYLASIYGFLVGYIVPFLIVLTLVVFVHEMGHYLVGRWCGIRILTFSVGFGPEIVGFNDKHGTRWKLSAIPLGGYVKFYGDENAASAPDFDAVSGMSDSEREQSFLGANVWKRVATVAAGPVANFILAIVIFAVMFSIYGRPVADPVVAQVQPASAAEEAGLLPGDIIAAIDGKPVATFEDIRRYVSPRPEVEIVLTVDRGGSTFDVPIVPQRSEIEDQFGNKMEVGLIGVVTDSSVANFRRQELNPLQAVGAAVGESWFIVARSVGYIGNIIIGREKADQLGGPIRVAQVSGQVATLGVGALLQLAAVLSVSIGFLNLLPIPMLDGGHLVFYAIEIIRGKPVGEKAQEVAFKIGLSLVLMLMLFATWNDVTMLFG
ncbi:RIP metalloprotease RseP [Hoeflea poritis]|uniref:Zinc metalloprotease n=1 Tax=Hoeflea poritis TaxID=2993659 RepID=A0ABT4VID0_9HYPH|nr:RIP metalloprotease RseP [Hoeflea poritis]MDA4843945.1 RIP metalloprotease RseP [Hoeflea poritis]